jgi:uncharacterized integral membrane protein
MSSKSKRNKRRQTKRVVTEKKPLINPKYKNTFWTIVVLIVLIIFFIVNNTRTEPEEGPYPPGYHPSVVDTNSVN